MPACCCARKCRAQSRAFVAVWKELEKSPTTTGLGFRFLGTVFDSLSRKSSLIVHRNYESDDINNEAERIPENNPLRVFGLVGGGGGGGKRRKRRRPFSREDDNNDSDGFE